MLAEWLPIIVNVMILRMIAGQNCHRLKKLVTRHPASTRSIISSLLLVVSTNRTPWWRRCSIWIWRTRPMIGKLLPPSLNYPCAMLVCNKSKRTEFWYLEVGTRRIRLPFVSSSIWKMTYSRLKSPRTIEAMFLRWRTLISSWSMEWVLMTSRTMSSWFLDKISSISIMLRATSSERREVCKVLQHKMDHLKFKLRPKLQWSISLPSKKLRLLREDLMRFEPLKRLSIS